MDVGLRLRLCFDVEAKVAIEVVTLCVKGGHLRAVDEEPDLIAAHLSTQHVGLGRIGKADPGWQWSVLEPA